MSLVALIETRPSVLEFSTSCAENVSVEVEETVEEVRISDVKGTAIDGGCGGSIFVQLEAPCGEGV